MLLWPPVCALAAGFEREGIKMLRLWFYASQHFSYCKGERPIAKQKNIHKNVCLQNTAHAKNIKDACDDLLDVS